MCFRKKNKKLSNIEEEVPYRIEQGGNGNEENRRGEEGHEDLRETESDQSALPSATEEGQIKEHSVPSLESEKDRRSPIIEELPPKPPSCLKPNTGYVCVLRIEKNSSGSTRKIVVISGHEVTSDFLPVIADDVVEIGQTIAGELSSVADNLRKRHDLESESDKTDHSYPASSDSDAQVRNRIYVSEEDVRVDVLAEDVNPEGHSQETNVKTEDDSSGTKVNADQRASGTNDNDEQRSSGTNVNAEDHPSGTNVNAEDHSSGTNVNADQHTSGTNENAEQHSDGANLAEQRSSGTNVKAEDHSSVTNVNAGQRSSDTNVHTEQRSSDTNVHTEQRSSDGNTRSRRSSQ